MKQGAKEFIIEMTEYEGEVIISVACPTMAVSVIMTPGEAMRLSSQLFRVYVDYLSGAKRESIDS